MVLTFITSLDKITISILFSILCWVVIYLRKIYVLYFYPDNIEEFKELYPESLVKYLDKYYVTNIYYTVSATIAYFIGNISIVLYLRYFLNNNKSDTLSRYPIDIDFVTLNNTSYLSIIGNIIIFIITLMFYKKMLDALFFLEVLKLHLYLRDNKYYRYIRCKINSIFVEELLEEIYLFFYNISKLREDPEDNDDYYNFSAHKDIYDNIKIAELSKFFVNLARNYKSIYMLILIILKIVKIILYIFIRRKLVRYMPYIIYFSVILYDFTQLRIYYSYYTFPIFYGVTLLLTILTFLETKSGTDDDKINDYFYKNDVKYEYQRNTFKDNSNIYIDILNTSKQNRTLFFRFRFNGNMITLKTYLCDNLIMNYKDPQNMSLELKGKAMINRYYILILLFICISYMIKQSQKYQIYLFYYNIDFPIIYVIIFVYIIISYAVFNTFKSLPNNVEDYLEDYKYNKYYNILYWILMPFLIALLYITIIKGTLFFITDGILWEFKGVQILRIYSIEEKIVFFNKYLNDVMNAANLPDIAISTIKIFIEETNIRELLMEQTTLKDVKTLIEEIFKHYSQALMKFIETTKAENMPLLVEENYIADTIIITLLITFLIVSTYITISQMLLLYFGKDFIVPLVRLRLEQLSVDATLASDEFIWEIAKLMIKKQYTIVYDLIKVKWGLG